MRLSLSDFTFLFTMTTLPLNVISNFLVCQHQDEGEVKVWCKSPDEFTRTAFVDCINACPYTESWVHSRDNTVMAVQAYGPAAFQYGCFLDCFFSQEIAIYRTEPAKEDNLAGYLNGMVACTDYGDAAYCLATDRNKGGHFTECLLKANIPVVYFLGDLDTFWVRPSEGKLTKNTHFQQCFFNENRGTAMLKPEPEALQRYLNNQLFKQEKPEESSQNSNFTARREVM